MTRFPLRCFIISMDTGILAVIIRKLPYEFLSRNVIADIFFVLNLALWISFFCITILQFGARPMKSVQHFRINSDDLLCCPAISISFTTIYEMIALSTESWSYTWQLLAYVLWWMTTFLSFSLGLIVLHTTIESGTVKLDDFDTTLLLSGIAALTSATGGGSLALQNKLSSDQVVPMVVVSYFLLGFGLALATMFTVLDFVRFYSIGPPSNNKLPSLYVLIGPFGQSSFAFQALGYAVVSRFPNYSPGHFFQPDVARAIGGSSMLIGIVLYGTGFLFFLFALSTTLHTLITFKQRGKTLKWSLAWWSFIFPIGVWTSATEQLASNLHSPALKVWSCVLVLSLVMVWFMNVITMLMYSAADIKAFLRTKLAS